MSAGTHRNRTLGLTAVLHAFTHIYQVALLPLYLRIQQELKLDTVEQATLLVTVLGIAYFGPSYLMGVLADRVSRKKLLTLGLAINGLGFVGLAAAPNYPWALASMVVAGFGGSFFHPAATSLIAGLFPEGRGRALGFLGVGASAGFFIGPFYSGWRAVASGGWRAPVFELGLFGVLAAGLFAWLAEEDVQQLGSAHSLHDKRRGPLFPRASAWWFFLAASVALSLRDFAGGTMASSASLFLQKAHGFDPKLAGLALSGIFLASAVSNPLFGRFSDRARMRWLTGVLAAAAILMGLFPRMPVGWLVPDLAAYGFFFMASYPMTEAAVMDSVADSVRGRVFGLFITVGGLISNLSHWVVGDWVAKLGDRASVTYSYYPLYGALTLMVLLSLTGLPCLRALRRHDLPADSERFVPSPGIPSNAKP